FVLNITNAYSSINISLLSRTKEIGTLYSLGMDKEDLKKRYSSDFIKEQIKSFILALIVTILIMLIASVLLENLTMKLMIMYYPWMYFIAFTIIIYFINISIYHSALERVLRRPIVSLIK